MLLALSGGIDSVVLAHLLKQSGFSFAMAHCNFKLRSQDSDGDEQFCIALAKTLGVEIYTTSFNIKKHCLEHKQSIQVAARNLRYDWFNKLVKEHQLDHIITAHHANDNIETVFINMLRGTGIKGLKGIRAVNGKIVRPLLHFTKEEINGYAKDHNIVFRLDKSNLEDKYERNFLRLNIIPGLKKINPKLEQTFIENSFRLAQENGIVTDFLTAKALSLKSEKNGSVIIDKNKLQKEAYKESILHSLLSPYGFNKTQQDNILEHVLNNATVGKIFITAAYELTIDRKAIIIKPALKNKLEAFEIKTLTALKKQAVFKVETIKAFTVPAKNELIISTGKLIFPLTVRTKQTGDRFKPFGMKGFRLLSDFFKDEKLNAFEKENCKLLVNGNGEIIWVAGHRSDERYKVEKSDKNLLKLALIGE